MTTQEFLAEHPLLRANQIIKLDTEQTNDTVTTTCPYLEWVRDEGNMAIMKATQYIDLYITHVRNGTVTSTAIIGMAIGDTVNIRQNLDNLNYDGYAC
jgi:hypothetical protein